MNLRINGEVRPLQAETLADLLTSQGFGGEAVATAVDGVFVPRAERARFQLAEGMAIEILAPMQGG